MVDSWHTAPGYLDLLAGFVGTAIAVAAPQEARRGGRLHRPQPARLHRGVGRPVPGPGAGDGHQRGHAGAPHPVVDRLAERGPHRRPPSRGWAPTSCRVLPQLASAGARGVVVCPCGFTSDHLEVLYDLDIEAGQDGGGHAPRLRPHAVAQRPPRPVRHPGGRGAGPCRRRLTVQPRRRRPHVVVVGGGITGLATAWFLRDRARVTVLEADDRLGGKIRTSVAGRACRWRRAPTRSWPGCPTPGPWPPPSDGRDLVEPATGKAFVWTRGRLRPLPEGQVLGVPVELGPLLRSGVLPPGAVARAGLDLVLPRSRRPAERRPVGGRGHRGADGAGRRRPAGGAAGRGHQRGPGRRPQPGRHRPPTGRGRRRLPEPHPRAPPTAARPPGIADRTRCSSASPAGSGGWSTGWWRPWSTAGVEIRTGAGGDGGRAATAPVATGWSPATGHVGGRGRRRHRPRLRRRPPPPGDGAGGGRRPRTHPVRVGGGGHPRLPARGRRVPPRRGRLPRPPGRAPADDGVHVVDVEVAGPGRRRAGAGPGVGRPVGRRPPRRPRRRTSWSPTSTGSCPTPSACANRP